MKPDIKSLTTRNIILIPCLMFFGLILIGCGTNKAASDPQNFEELRDLAENREFTIEFQWAQPMGGGMIDLLSNPNHIKFTGEEVDIFLPYFGVRHRGGGYGNNTGGIRYEGKMTNLDIIQNPSKQNILMTFEGQQDSEILLFNVTLFENGKAHASVSSSDRNSIVYQGGDIKENTEEIE